MLAKRRLNSVKTLICQCWLKGNSIALDSNISSINCTEIIHEEFSTISKEKDKYEKMKDNLKSEMEKYKIMRWSSIKSKS